MADQLTRITAADGTLVEEPITTGEPYRAKKIKLTADTEWSNNIVTDTPFTVSFDQSRFGGTPDLELDADSVEKDAEDGTVLYVGISLTAEESAQLAGTGTRRFWVDVCSATMGKWASLTALVVDRAGATS